MGQGAGAPRAQLSCNNVSQDGRLGLELGSTENVLDVGPADSDVAGGCDLHVVTGVQTICAPLHGQVIILCLLYTSPSPRD